MKRSYRSRTWRRTWPRNLLGCAAGAALLVLTLGVAACADRSQAWSQPESPKKNKIEWVVYDHAVTHTFGQNGLGATERRRLDKFINEISLGYGDQVVIRARRGEESPAALAVTRHFRRNNVVAKIIETPRLDTRAGPVLVEVGRYVITPPRCPDWTKPSGTDSNNTVSSNWGCATAVNLDRMVANPGDLVHGRELGPADGTYATFHIERYRKGAAPSNKVTSSGFLTPVK